MHELSIACDLVEIAEAAAREAQVKQVDVVHLKLGVLAGIVKEALLFSYDIAVQGTLLEGSRLEIEDIPLVFYCPVCACEREQPSIQSFLCPNCGNPVREIRHGTELELAYLEIGEHEPQTA